MNDRELLELAAKAAGYTIIYNEDVFSEGFLTQKDYDNEFGKNTAFVPWNPITDDGDALRLAVELKIDVAEAVEWYCTEEEYKADPYAATRRAIVRAAAEIGKTL